MKKGYGIKSCGLSLCIVMSLILICGMDIEVNPGPTETRFTTMEQRSTRTQEIKDQVLRNALDIGRRK